MKLLPFMAAALLIGGAGSAWAAGKKPASTPASKSATSAPAETKDRDDRPAEPSAPAASAPETGSAPVPVFLSEIANPNDFVLFANGGGWDGNWYVGYNTCWVSKLPPAPPGKFERAFLGARLGRMKTESVPGRPSWEKRPIRGQVQIAVAPEPLWPQSHRFLLTETQDIPLEGDSENAVEGVGESRWFWVEVPVKFISQEKDNYVALYSPTEALSDARRAPVLAAGWGDTRQNSWLNSTVKGEPPFTPEEALKTVVTYFEPAIAIKLVPPNREKPKLTMLAAPEAGSTAADKMLFSATLEGRDVTSAWVEFSTDTKHWHRAGAALSSPPYIFTVKKESLLEGNVRLRVAAEDVLENRVFSDIVPVVVPAAAPPKKKSK